MNVAPVKITGNTYPVREQLKALGGRYNAADKSWTVPADRAEEARKLVKPSRSGNGYTPRKCRACGCKINYGVFCGKCEFGR